MPIYEYHCEECGEVFERMLPLANRNDIQICECGGDAPFIVSAPSFKLEGVSGDFPTAYDQWEKRRRQKMALENKE